MAEGCTYSVPGLNDPNLECNQIQYATSPTGVLQRQPPRQPVIRRRNVHGATVFNDLQFRVKLPWDANVPVGANNAFNKIGPTLYTQPSANVNYYGGFDIGASGTSSTPEVPDPALQGRKDQGCPSGWPFLSALKRDLLRTNAPAATSHIRPLDAPLGHNAGCQIVSPLQGRPACLTRPIPMTLRLWPMRLRRRAPCRRMRALLPLPEFLTAKARPLRPRR